MPDFDFNGDTKASFAEWRGAVKSGFNFVRQDLQRLEAERQGLWSAIGQIRAAMEKARDRCDRINREKALASDVEQLRMALKRKASASDVKGLGAEVVSQGKIQSKQGVTVMFYGVLGGVLFSVVMALFTRLLSLLTARP